MQQNSMMYPLRFEPILRRYIWGGRKLETLFGKALGSGNDYAESWEVVDHREDQSRVAYGPLCGTTLNDLVCHHGQRLLGREVPGDQFPLLLKLLDAHRDLSVQVHPNDEHAAQLHPPDQGKTEAWVVLDAEPGARIYAGLLPGIDRDRLAQAVADGAVADCLHAFEPSAGDCIFMPAGTVHALGAGLVVAEIQQASDTTFRLFDWNRVDRNGESRPLHIDQALQVIDYSAGPVTPRLPQPTADPDIELLVECDKFVLRRWRVQEPKMLEMDGRFHLVVAVGGSVQVEGDCAPGALQRGATILIPADCGPTRISPVDGATLLEIHLPDPGRAAG